MVKPGGDFWWIVWGENAGMSNSLRWNPQRRLTKGSRAGIYPGVSQVLRQGEQAVVDGYSVNIHWYQVVRPCTGHCTKLICPRLLITFGLRGVCGS